MVGARGLPLALKYDDVNIRLLPEHRRPALHDPSILIRDVVTLRRQAAPDRIAKGQAETMRGIRNHVPVPLPFTPSCAAPPVPIGTAATNVNVRATQVSGNVHQSAVLTNTNHRY